MNHTFVFLWTRRFISKCQLKNSSRITFCFLGAFQGQNIKSEQNLMTPGATCRLFHRKEGEKSFLCGGRE